MNVAKALFYAVLIVSLIDVIPDVIPVLGWTDDVVYLLRMGRHLYRAAFGEPKA